MPEAKKRRELAAGWGVCLTCKQMQTCHKTGVCKPCRNVQKAKDQARAKERARQIREAF
jgi:hypothetical protein